MVQLLSPVCADKLKFHKPSPGFCSRYQWPMLPGKSVRWGLGEREEDPVESGLLYGSSSVAGDLFDDYYAVLGLMIQNFLSCYFSKGDYGFRSGADSCGYKTRCSGPSSLGSVCFYILCNSKTMPGLLLAFGCQPGEAGAGHERHMLWYLQVKKSNCDMF